LLSAPLTISRSRIPLFLNIDWPKLGANCDVESNFSIDDFSLDLAVPSFKLHLAGGLAILQAKLDVYYDERSVAAMSNDNPWLADPQAPTTYYLRNFEAEQNAISRLRRHGFQGPDGQGLYHLKGQEMVLNFFAREYTRLCREWKVTLEERLERSTKQNLERIEPQFQITPSGEQWFDLHVSYQASGSEPFSPADIQRLLLSGQSHTRLRNGKFALLDTGAVEELQEVLVDCAPQQHNNGYRLNSKQSGFLDATLARQPGWQVQAPAAWKERAAQQRGAVKLIPPPLGKLETVLRAYQKEGIAWINFLRGNGFGGILADEMGLGKTLQVLALLNLLKAKQSSPGSAPALVVCPTSLVFNWAMESAKFTPALRVLVMQGQDRREKVADFTRHDLVITSYALLRRDVELYQHLEFETVVLDEAQHIKNRQTQNAQAVKAIRSRNRLVLTGTPMENSVLDLWSIFDFLMPGYLGTAQDFRERYELPITRDKSREAQDRLARRLRPFVLRRMKREVATDLPQRIEQVSFCELNDEQSAVYRQILDTSRQEIVNAVGTNGLAKSRMLVLTALLRLRQICCDLRLLPVVQSSKTTSEEPPNKVAEQVRQQAGSIDPESRFLPVSTASGKVELFNELLEEVLDGGHRVLVFSQFTTMLGLLAQELTGQNIKFCYLDGTTKNRQEVVETFQKDTNIPVFLISLKAGGVGLNLTGADTVFHFDPWWNPAVEAQATDRAHRIGQKKIVTSYKFIARGTVEEKILNLQTRKRALLSNMLGEEEQVVEALNWEEIQDLLAE
jgi:SNF2 family DNA or RNA helicase